MKLLLATCGAAALVLAGCGGPHGPPKHKQAQAPDGAQQQAQAPGNGEMAAYGGYRQREGGPHGPPRVLQNPVVPTEPYLYDDILDKYGDGPEPHRVRDCKLRHLRKYRKTENLMRNSGKILDETEEKFLEDWLSAIIKYVYPADLPDPPSLPDDPEGPEGHIPDNCQPW